MSALITNEQKRPCLCPSAKGQFSNQSFFKSVSHKNRYPLREVLGENSIVPYSLSRPPSVRIAQNGFPSYNQSPTPTPPLIINHLGVAAAETINGLEDRIAHLEASHTQISLELDSTRDTLFQERSTRHGSDSSSQSQSSEAYDMFGRPDTMNSLKATCTKNSTLSRSLDKHTQLNKPLMSDLESERFARGAVEEEMKCLKALNLAFSEQNNLFTNWTVSPEDLSDPETNENTLYLRQELATTNDELRITQRKLATSDNRCNVLTQKVSSLQQSITICVDETAKALDVERELRFEIQARLQDMVEANKELRSKWNIGKTRTDVEPLTEPWKRDSNEVRRMEEWVINASEGCFALESNPKEAGRFVEMSKEQQLRDRVAFLVEEVERYKAREVDFMVTQRELLIDVHTKSSAYRRLVRRKLKCDQVHCASERRSPEQRSFAIPAEIGPSELLVQSTLQDVARTPKNKQRMLDILSVTLAKTSSILKIFPKAESSVFVDTINTLSPVDAHVGRVM